MAEIIFGKDGVTYRETIETPFGQVTLEKKVDYNEIKGLKLSSVSINPIIENGILKAIKMDVDEFEVLDKKKKNLKENHLSDLIERRLKERKWPSYVKVYARALLNPNTMAATIRRIIKEKKKISDKELRELIKKEGYNPEGGSYSAVLNVLDRFTEEIKRTGRGKNKTYEWIGGRHED